MDGVGWDKIMVENSNRNNDQEGDDMSSLGL